MRIPLLRPQLPASSRAQAFYRKSQKANFYANFGPCYDQIVKDLFHYGYVLPVSTGTAAIHLAAAVHLPKMSRVVVPDFTCAATVLAIVSAGHYPVIAPCDPKTWAIDLEVLGQSKVPYDALCVVVPFGYQIDFGSYRRFCRERGKRLIWDAAGAWGVDIGPGEDPVCYSLHATKNLSTGEGGLVVFQNAADHEKARRLSNFGFDETRGTIDCRGTNAKLDEWRCAMLLAALSDTYKMNARIQRKRDLIQKYQHHLPGTAVPYHAVDGAPSVCVLSGFHRPLWLEAEAAKKGIGLRPYYHPLLSEQAGLQHLTILPECREVAPFFKTCLGLPSDVSPKEFREVVDFIRPLL